MSTDLVKKAALIDKQLRECWSTIKMNRRGQWPVASGQPNRPIHGQTAERGAK